MLIWYIFVFYRCSHEAKICAFFRTIFIDVKDIDVQNVHLTSNIYMAIHKCVEQHHQFKTTIMSPHRFFGVRESFGFFRTLFFGVFGWLRFFCALLLFEAFFLCLFALLWLLFFAFRFLYFPLFFVGCHAWTTPPSSSVCFQSSFKIVGIL